ncbi:MAG: cytidyltransferase-related domain-containing protein [Monoraphidium minutum]|nr:MAG: cytidyltransferase-related domain-containing protein [Monoraphidium minutum]
MAAAAPARVAEAEGAAAAPAAPPSQLRKGFCSGCYDVIHGGHVEFFTQAKELCDYLIVSVASEGVLAHHKAGRRASMPTAHKVALLSALRMVDEVVVGDDLSETGLDFKDHFLAARPQLLIVTEDDRYGDVKRALCDQVGASYVVLPKSLDYEPTSTTQILRNIRTPSLVPLRVDFAGGWLDVPKHAVPGASIVNCAVSPLVSLGAWPYHIGGGLGGSAAHALLSGRDAVESELAAGVGWQDPAVIRETGLCVWASGPRPELEFKTGGGFLRGRMALMWTGAPHVTATKTDLTRDYGKIAAAGAAARAAALPGGGGVEGIAAAVGLSYEAQRGEGMAELPGHGALARKYCGGGWGGYALYIFSGEAQRAEFLATVAETHAIEPYQGHVA